MSHDTDIKRQALVNPGTHESTTNTKDDNKKSTKVMEELSIVDRVKLFKWEWKLWVKILNLLEKNLKKSKNV